MSLIIDESEIHEALQEKETRDITQEPEYEYA
jgi:hypothetical protein